MADAKISQQNTNNTVAGADLMPIVGDPGGTPSNEFRTVDEVGDHIVNSTQVSGQPAKPHLVEGDMRRRND